MSENIQKGFLERAENKVNGIFLNKNQKLFKKLDTGPKVMADIDASTIIAHSYLDLLQTKGMNEDEDLFNQKLIEKTFIQAACLVDPKKYAKILSLDSKWANFEFKLNIQEYFSKDKEFLEKFQKIDENHQEESKRHIFSNFFRCFRKNKVHTLPKKISKTDTTRASDQ